MMQKTLIKYLSGEILNIVRKINESKITSKQGLRTVNALSFSQTHVIRATEWYALIWRAAGRTHRGYDNGSNNEFAKSSTFERFTL